MRPRTVFYCATSISSPQGMRSSKHVTMPRENTTTNWSLPYP